MGSSALAIGGLEVKSVTEATYMYMYMYKYETGQCQIIHCMCGILTVVFSSEVKSLTGPSTLCGRNVPCLSNLGPISMLPVWTAYVNDTIVHLHSVDGQNTKEEYQVHVHVVCTLSCTCTYQAHMHTVHAC